MVLKTPESAVGVDPNILSASTWEQLDSDLEAAGHTLVPVAPNLIDKIWENRPGQPCNSLMTLDISFTGMFVLCTVGETKLMCHYNVFQFLLHNGGGFDIVCGIS